MTDKNRNDQERPATLSESIDAVNAEFAKIQMLIADRFHLLTIAEKLRIYQIFSTIERALERIAVYFIRGLTHVLAWIGGHRDGKDKSILNTPDDQTD